jgi:dihydrofolate reductase
MRKLIIQEWISLDGYAADKHNKLDFFVPTVRDIYQDEYHARILKNIDCIIFGKNTYQIFSAVWPDRSGDLVSEIINRSKKIVFSKSLRDAPWGKWDPATIVSTDFESKILELKSLPGKNIVIWGSISLTEQAMKAQVVDEYQIHICPIITGGGRKLITDEHTAPLKLLHSNHLNNGVVSLHYQV